MQSDGNLSTSYVIVSSGVVSYLNNGVDDHGLNPISLQKKETIRQKIQVFSKNNLTYHQIVWEQIDVWNTKINYTHILGTHKNTENP